MERGNEEMVEVVLHERIRGERNGSRVVSARKIDDAVVVTLKTASKRTV